MKKLLRFLVVTSLASGVIYCVLPQQTQTTLSFVKSKTTAKYTTNARLEQFGSAVQARLLPHFEKVGVPFPPQAITLLAFKDSKHVELYAPDTQGAWQRITDYPIQAASGNLGPKLKEGDRQVPEGIYSIELLNPNSLYHVSLRLNYPNAFDQEMAATEERTQLGSDIMIHGKAASMGCLAMGDTAAEELFALAAWLGKENIKVVIAPTDFRVNALQKLDVSLPVWAEALYDRLRVELVQYPVS
jgi:hypothetical protein